MASSAGSPRDITPADPTLDKPPRIRRGIPVSVRLLIALLLAFGIVEFSWIAVRGYTNAVIIRDIENAGGQVFMRQQTSDRFQQQG